MQINKNNDDNSDVAKSQNKNMNEVQHCWKIVREETKGRNQDCTDPENFESIEQERCGKEINNYNSEITVDIRKMEKKSI